MKCMVTGAAGFIGSHLCERLLKDGHEVLGVDDLSTGQIENLTVANRQQNFRFIKGDVASRRPGFVDRVDWLFHLAAKADVVPSIEKPDLYHAVNVTGTFNMLRYAQATGVKRFIYAASSSCYGIPAFYPTPESAYKHPMYPYALTKLLGEQYVMHWAQVFKLPAVSLRLFNVFGPRSRTTGSYGAVFGVFLAQLANDRPLTIVGDGQQSRDFTFVSDVVEAFLKAAESDKSGQCYNIGTGRPQSVSRLAKLLGGQDFEFLPDRPGEPRRTQADITKAREDLGWEPRLCFEEGIQVMRMYVEEFKSAPLWDRAKIQKATESWFKYLGAGR